MASLFNFFFSFQLLSALFESLLFLIHAIGLGPAPTLTTQGLSDVLSFFLWFPLLFLTWTKSKTPLGLVMFLLSVSLWSHLGFWPYFPLDGTIPQRTLSGSLIVLGAHTLALLYRRHKTRDTFGLYAPDAFDESSSFPWVRVFLSFPSSLLALGLICLGLSLGASLDRLLLDSKGHVKIQRDGLYTRSEIYVKDEQEVHLIGMMHIAEKSFYKDLLESLPTEDSLVLSEGVSDEKNLLEGGFRYKGLADKLSLSDQGEDFQRKLMTSHKIMRADLDVSQLRPETIEFLKNVSRLYRGESPLSDLPKLMDPKLGEVFKLDLINRRNQEVLRVFDEQASHYKTLIIPWGALHNAEIAEGLQQRGYKLKEVQYRRVLYFI